MWATYLAGGVGIAIAFSTLGDTRPLWVGLPVGRRRIRDCFFVRHSVFHRSDAAAHALGSGRAQQLPDRSRVVTWHGDWSPSSRCCSDGAWLLGPPRSSFGIYLLGVVGMQVVSPGGKRRSPAPLIAMAAFGMMLVLVGILE